jgi:hypothetical protein
MSSQCLLLECMWLSHGHSVSVLRGVCIFSEPAGYLHDLLWLDMINYSYKLVAFGSSVSVALPPVYIELWYLSYSCRWVLFTYVSIT